VLVVREASARWGAPLEIPMTGHDDDAYYCSVPVVSNLMALDGFHILHMFCAFVCINFMIFFAQFGINFTPFEAYFCINSTHIN